MKAFVDWSITRGFYIILEEDGEIVSEGEAEDLNLPADCDVYIETGCPRYLLYTLIERGHRVYQCPGKLVKQKREQLKRQKSDATDAQLIRQLYHDNPSAFRQLRKPDFYDARLAFLMGKYQKITKMIVATKNRQKAAEREYGRLKVYDKILKLLEGERERILRQVSPFIETEYKRVKHIKGLGKALFAQLRAEANPKRFPTLSKYLIYCGYKGCVVNRYRKGDGRRPNYTAKSLLYQIAEQTIRHRDPTYRPLYDRCKQRLKERHPDWTKAHVHGAALNRVATFIAKEVWQKLHNFRTLPELLDETRSEAEA